MCGCRPRALPGQHLGREEAGRTKSSSKEPVRLVESRRWVWVCEKKSRPLGAHRRTVWLKASHLVAAASETAARGCELGSILAEFCCPEKNLAPEWTQIRVTALEIDGSETLYWAPRDFREAVPNIVIPFPQASGPGPKPSDCPHRLSTSAGAGCAACRGSSGPGWDWAPEKTQTLCLTQSGSLGALALDARTWPSITLGHLHVHGLTICFANHYPPPVACTFHPCGV